MVSPEGSQNPVIDFLSDPRSYGLTKGPVERHETHGSMVFLARNRAYKLKRSVKLPYMDYSTRALRRQMCERELVVNHRMAPQLYLGTQSIIRRSEGALAFGEPGDPAALDWVVVMRRFDQDDVLEPMRQNGRLTRALMRSLAIAVADFHSRADIVRKHGGAGSIAAVVKENTAMFASRAGRPFDPQKIERFSNLSRDALERVRALLDQRREQGSVKHCHGDLHLNNICLIAGQPVLFDAIEFNDAFAFIDVLYDLAFLLMDLDRHDLRGHANLVLNTYLERTRDYAGLAALPLFLSCRAAIRAHVCATTAGLLPSQDEAQAKREEAAVLLDRAIAYLEPPEPQLIAIGGVSGTGKSTLARYLAPDYGPAPGALVIRSDVIRKTLMGVDETTRLPASAYSPETHRQVYEAMAELSATILAAGHAVITDAVYASAAERAAIERVAKKAKVPFRGLWLEADPMLLRDRIAKRTGDASDATVEVLERQLTFIDRPENWAPIDASSPDPEAIAADARCRLQT